MAGIASPVHGTHIRDPGVGVLGFHPLGGGEGVFTVGGDVAGAAIDFQATVNCMDDVSCTVTPRLPLLAFLP